jgi:predicted DNA-binding protein (MmcQ/YjbR family)
MVAVMITYNKEEIEECLSGLRGGESSYPFGPEALVYKVMGKMYALVSQKGETPRVTLKVNPADGEVLVSLYESVIPGYYMNKRHWITISLTGELPLEMIKELSEESYELVVSKLTKKDREKLKGMA